MNSKVKGIVGAIILVVGLGGFYVYKEYIQPKQTVTAAVPVTTENGGTTQTVSQPDPYANLSNK